LRWPQPPCHPDGCVRFKLKNKWLYRNLICSKPPTNILSNFVQLWLVHLFVFLFYVLKKKQRWLYRWLRSSSDAPSRTWLPPNGDLLDAVNGLSRVLNWPLNLVLFQSEIPIVAIRALQRWELSSQNKPLKQYISFWNNETF